MATQKQFPFGRPNFETAGRWLGVAPELDGPLWMVNLMKYRAVADYGDSDVDGADGVAEGSAPITGKQADDAYAPLGPLAAMGAVVAFHGDVTAQAAGDPAWDRIGIVRYASRASFFAMQERDDFKKQYTHKKAGMEFTIVMGCLPTFADEASPADGDSYVMRVRRFADGATPGDDPAGVRPVATFDVDGVILGDDRRWDEVRFDLADDAAIAQMQHTSGVDEQVIVRVERSIDRLVDTVVTARE
jgi:hypothetical protein